MDETDVLVLGGGPAGAAAAITLAQAGVRCAVLESQLAPAWKIGETLAPEARQILSALGEWGNFLRDGHLPSPGNCSAWGSDEVVAKDFIFNPHGSAWQLDRPRYESALLTAAASAGARVERGQTMQAIRRTDSGWEIIAEENEFRATWVVDATGRGAAVARSLGITRTTLDKLVAIYAVVPALPELDADARTQIEAVADGWWYSALMPGGRRNFSFQTDADLLPDAQPWREAEWFWARVNETSLIRTQLKMPEAAHPVAPKLTSANSSRLATCHGDRWVAVGDAAQSFDPLSGEGLFHALFTGQQAAQGILQQHAGRVDALADYAALNEALWRRFLHQRQIFYASETRWPQRPFWQRRVATF